jgi:hypothetical protein
VAVSSSRPLRRSRSAGAALALVLALATVVGTSTAPAGASPGEFVARINGTRGARGLAPLAVSGELSAKAQAWAAHMASVGQISHSGNLASGVSANWTKLGENVGVGGTVDGLHNAFVGSPSHYRNIVDPDYDYIGVGVVHAGGVMYTAHVFMAVAGSAAPPSSPPSAQPAPRPSAPRGSSSGSGSSGGGGSSSSGRGSGTYGGTLPEAPSAPPPPPPPPPPPVPDPLAALPGVLAELRALDARS